MNTRPVRILALSSLSVVLLFFLLVRSFIPGSSSSGRGDMETRHRTLVEDIIQLVRKDYIDRAEPGRTMEGAYRGLFNSLDMLSSYLSQDDLAKYKETTQVPFRDTGLVLIKAPGGMPQVVGFQAGRPAAKAELRRGDFISSVDNRSTFGLSLLEVRLLLCSQEDRPVKLRIVRQTSTVELSVERTLPPAKDCQFAPEKGTAGVLTVYRFSLSLSASLKSIIPASVEHTAGPFILDLRGCAEGDPEGAGRLVNMFLRLPQAGSFLMRDGSREPFSCPETAVWEKTPLIVWVDRATLGPAEIAAGVLQSAKRARVVGFPTPGLASKQKLYPLNDGSAILLTTGLFCTASGEKVWEKGITPDVVLSEEAAERSHFLQKTLSLTSGR